MYFRTSSGCSRIASEIAQKMTPCLASVSRNVVPTDTLSNTASTATPAVRSSSPAGQALLLPERDPQFLKGLEQLGVHLVQAIELRHHFGSRVVTDGLIVDRAVVHVGPVWLGHLQPVA